MRTLEVNDHVVLKQDTRLYGTISRTHLVPSSDFPEIELRLAHTTVPPEVYDAFVATGVPPAGYVFVQWGKVTDGSSLVDENDLTLLSRAFQIGNLVRRHSRRMSGTVVDVDETYTLSPLACDREVAKELSVEQVFPSCSPACASHPPLPFSHPNPHALIYNVPSREIKGAQDVIRDDYLISDRWMGLISDVEYNVVIALENKSVVVVTGFDGVNLPLENNGIPLVGMSIPGDGTHRGQPDFSDPTNVYGIRVKTLRPGDHIVINHRRLKEGRWIRGSHDRKCRRHGVVLDIRARQVTTKWLVDNQGRKPSASTITIPESEQFIYENVDSFRDPAQLTFNKYVSVYDSTKMPSKTTAAAAAATSHSRTTSIYPQETQNVFPALSLPVGAHVRFRDPTEAAVKYQGSEDNSHGRLMRVVSVDYHDWDFNEFIIVDMKQKATVLWQDGSITTSDSISLHNYGSIPPEPQPTNIALMREGMLQRPTTAAPGLSSETSDFDEMAVLQSLHDVIPQKVGIIQTVDRRERVASIRWYQKPKIEIRASASFLGHRSYFGPIGDTVSDVSYSEILSFPLLKYTQRDMCIPADSVEVARRRQYYEAGESVDISPPANPTALRAALERKAERDRASRSEEPRGMPGPRTEPNGAGPRDWVGQVVANGLDGSLTVRLGAARHCRDVRIDLDEVLKCIPGDRYYRAVAEANPTDEDDLDQDIEMLDDSSDDSHSLPRSESVEREGGGGLDDDEGDEDWISDYDLSDADDEGDENWISDYDLSDADVEMGEVDDLLLDVTPEEAALILGQRDPISASVPPEPAKDLLSTTVPLEPPPQFLILDQEPPADQFGLRSVSSAPGVLKRIAREHKILASSLPKREIFVRTYESRLDLFRCLIVGPRDTPYEDAPFLVDLLLPAGFPKEPPTAHFHSWTNGMGRINPNLYVEGKVCLSLLGTWSGKHETETWNSTATILQILVSLQGLVFVKNPYYNEAGFEGYEDDPRYFQAAERYSEKAFVLARRFAKHALVRPPKAMEDVLAWLYLPRHSDKPDESLLGTIIKRGKLLIERSESAKARKDQSLLDSQGDKDDPTKVFLRPLSRGGIIMLNRIIGELQAELNRLTRVESCGP